MKYLILFFLLCGNAYGDSQLLSNALFCGLIAADRIQTEKISTSKKYEEKNPALPKSPSIRTQNAYFTSACAGFILANKYLPEKIHIYKKYYIKKEWVSRFTIGAQASAVGYNLSMGVAL